MIMNSMATVSAGNVSTPAQLSQPQENIHELAKRIPPPPSKPPPDARRKMKIQNDAINDTSDKTSGSMAAVSPAAENSQNRKQPHNSLPQASSKPSNFVENSSSIPFSKISTEKESQNQKNVSNTKKSSLPLRVESDQGNLTSDKQQIPIQQSPWHASNKKNAIQPASQSLHPEIVSASTNLHSSSSAFQHNAYSATRTAPASEASKLTYQMNSSNNSGSSDMSPLKTKNVIAVSHASNEEISCEQAKDEITSRSAEIASSSICSQDLSHLPGTVPKTDIIDRILQSVSRLAKLSMSDHEVVQHSSELLVRCKDVEELVSSAEIQRYQIFPVMLNALKGVLKTLSNGIIVCEKMLSIRFRRNARFKNSVRITVNNLMNDCSKIRDAASIAVSEYTRMMIEASNLKKSSGEEECQLGDQYYYGHNVERNLKIAADHYHESARLGYGRAMFNLGVMLRDGVGISKNFSLAVQNFMNAAKLHNADALNALGELYEAGKGVSLDLSTALSYYERAANANHSDAMANLGYIFEHGAKSAEYVIECDPAAARSWYKRSAGFNNSKGQNNYAFCLYKDGNMNDAFSMWLTSAEQGNAIAMYNLGICYEQGHGCDQNEAEALKWYEESSRLGHIEASASAGYLHLKYHRYSEALPLLSIAATAGHSDACYHLGRVYSLGLGVQQTPSHAHYWWSRSKHSMAALELGHTFFSGQPRDLRRAFQYYEQSALAKVPEACNCLGIMLEDGLGCEANIQKAIFYYQQAAAANNADALFNLSVLYEKGKGVDRNLEQSLKMLEESAKSGSVQARIKCEQLRLRNFQHPAIHILSVAG